VFKTFQATRKKVGQVKDRATSTLETLDEKPHKDDEVGKYEIQYDAPQKEYDFSVNSILEQLKHKVAKFFGIV
jgi:hypothetical protein